MDSRYFDERENKNSALAQLKCIYCEKDYSGVGPTIRIRGHLAGTITKGSLKSCQTIQGYRFIYIYTMKCFHRAATSV